jgi:tetratricopeptide (TPR) repeat protein
MMKNCKALSDKIAANEIVNERSFSENEKALKFYDKGIQASQKEDYKKAVDYFEKAVKEDPQFTFAWDNLGVNYRRLNNFDKAIECYKNSLDIDPFGMMPLQNIAVAYQYKKEYDKAIKAYEKLATIDKNNPEIFYGIGNIYAMNLNDFEKGLDNMCKAYNIYVDQKSPYRADAEKMINMIYGEMKDKGKEDVFNKILEQNHISPDSK